MPTTSSRINSQRKSEIFVARAFCLCNDSLIMGLIDDIAGMPKRKAASIKELTQQQKSAVEQDVENQLAQLAYQQSRVDLSGAASFDTPAPEQDKRVTVTLKPVLRSVDVETGDDVGVAVQRVVGGEVKVTLRF